jgi:glycosyltransferase involved in cell wall biosynthesis
VNLAWVLPRWGVDIVGGAEQAARGIAERLANRPGWSVEVYTTTARDHFTWADVLPAGDEVVNGVTVHRFPADPRGLDADPRLAARVLGSPRAASPRDAERFVDAHGPCSPGLLDALGDCAADVVVFSPYLFATTVRGVPLVVPRAVMAAAAHDEPLLHLPVFEQTFRASSGFVFYTDEERRLVEDTFHVADKPRAVLGLGVDPAGARNAGGAGMTGDGALPGDLAGRRYLMSLGRVEEGKGSMVLARFFARYKERRPSDLALVMAGPVPTPERYEHPDIVLPGPVDEATKWALLRQAAVFVNPSPYESFSIVLMEAWSAELPALVNGGCAVTRGHALRSGGGLPFGDYLAFEGALDRLLEDADLRARLGARGSAYVADRYSWPHLVDGYAAFLQRMAEGARAAA